jgi:AbrB family looped-hinge helix DNA binding protein
LAKRRATITSKGQVTIPAEIRDEMGLQAGDQLEFGPNAGGAIVIRKTSPKTSVFDRWVGVGKPIAGLTVDEMIDEMRGR